MARNSRNHKWRPFKEALAWAHAQNIKNRNDWRKLIKSKNFPSDIPKVPTHIYKKELQGKGSGYWYGTGAKSTHQMQHRSFESARKFVRNLKLKNRQEWIKYCDSGNKPQDIAKTPSYIYKNKGWKSWSDWLGHDYIAPRLREYKTFEASRKFAQSLNFENRKQWWDFSKTNKKPEDIPSAPNTTYKDKGWNGWSDFLGTNRSRNYRQFENAIKFVHSLKLKSQSDWKKYVKSGKLPLDIPRSPKDGYKKNWKGWGDWLGTGRVADQLKEYRNFIDAKKFVHTLHLSGQSQWREFCKSDDKPEDIPAVPTRTYKKEWISWGDWLGTGKVSTRIINKEYLSFKDARDEVRKLAKQHNIKNWEDWRNAVKKGLIPKNIPALPNRVYSKRRKKDDKKV